MGGHRFNELSGIDVTSLVELLRGHPGSDYPARPLDEASRQASPLTQQRQRQSLGSAIQGLTMVPGVVRRDDASVWRVGGLCTAMQLLAEAEH